MTDTREDKERLLKVIRDKRRRIESYIRELEPRGSRLTNRTIIFGGVASLLTAAQLAFGKASASLLNSIHLVNGVSLWQVLAVAATISSAVATVAGALYKQQEIASRLAKAQSCATKLEALETSLDLGLTTLKDGNARYSQHIAEIPFVPATAWRKGGGTGAVDAVKGQIGSPAAREFVPRSFRATGVATDVGPEIHLWLVIEVGGLIWPKEGEVIPDEGGDWTANVFEDGATDEFALSLFAADRRGHKRISSWLDSGKRLGRYDQLQSLPGARRVARVESLRLASK